jgi:NOL1/NOP2/fmu family ribosome biogenesis protein
MQKLSILNTREKKKIIDSLRETYGFLGVINGALLLSSKQKLYLMSRAVEIIGRKEEKEIRIDKAGLYLGCVENEGIRLSIEGSQLIGPLAKKHVLEIDEAHLKPWVKGEDFALSENEKKQVADEQGFFIIKFQKDFLGCAQIKKGNVRSLVSKERRLKVLNR